MLTRIRVLTRWSWGGSPVGVNDSQFPSRSHRIRPNPAGIPRFTNCCEVLYVLAEKKKRVFNEMAKTLYMGLATNWPTAEAMQLHPQRSVQRTIRRKSLVNQSSDVPFFSELALRTDDPEGHRQDIWDRWMLPQCHPRRHGRDLASQMTAALHRVVVSQASSLSQNQYFFPSPWLS